MLGETGFDVPAACPRTIDGHARPDVSGWRQALGI
jgi:hypothetical protein